MPILLGMNSIFINPYNGADIRVHPGCIDSVFIPQRVVQSRTAPTPLSQGEG